MILSKDDMYRKGAILVMVLFFLMVDANAQHLSHQVLVPAANVLVGGGYNYSQTIGETAVEIIGTGEFTLTQGFQQPGITFILDPPPPGTGVEVFPNPVSDILYIKLWGKESRTFRISIININGMIVYSDEIKYSDNYYNKEEISVSNLISGFYFVRVLSKDGVINRSFKLEKM
jgi:hypothetical protein